ncbi:MAG: TIGR00159 family protein, partial [Bacteroidetes bacterium]|nr:TIGR00159 family protein [Bacteroidota bacterium]
MEFLEIGIIEIIDIALVAILIYQIYKLIKGTVAMNIFIGLAAIYILWKIVSAFHLQLLGEILGQFIGFGVILLAIVFQQELRKFLMMIGKGKVMKNKGLFKFNFTIANDNQLNTLAITKACENMAKTKTGAIMIVTQIDDLAVFCESG